MFARSTTVKFRFFQFARSYVTLDLRSPEPWRSLKVKATLYEQSHATNGQRSKF